MESLIDMTGKMNAAVLVASITGVTSLPDTADATALSGVINRSLEALEPIVKLYGGKMNPFTGSQFTTFFSNSGSQENYPFRALSAALEMRSRIEGMVSGQELPEGTYLRAGITIGDVIVMTTGKGITKQTAVIGTPVDLALRIQDLAEPGQILVGPEAWQRTQDQFAFDSLEPVPLKGHKKPVELYELTGKKQVKQAATGDTARMIASEMVGREPEARQVEEMIKQLLNGRGSVLCIEGTAGIGKSRLVTEIRTKEITGNVAFFEGRALSEGKNLSFHPIIQIIKSWAGIVDQDNPAASYQKLSQNIYRIYPDQAQEILPFVSTMMGFPPDEQGRQRLKGIEGEALEKLILKNVRDLLSRATNLLPVVLMIEDAHWADLTTVSFVESLFKLVKTHRLMFIVVFRPGFKETGERLKAFVRENLPNHGREMVLKPLTQEESGELIGNLMNRTNLPDDIRQLIITRSEGNPFFIEEVIRSFIDEELVEVKEGRFVVTEQVRYANIPETIDKVILSRIERLDEKTKSLLKTASVIGRNFYYKVLEEAAQAIEELDSRLEYLKETQLLNENRHKEDVEFLFKHALAQQATYESILLKTRKELHLKIARSIEKVFAEKIHEFYGILAMHYAKAEVPEKQREYLIKAGDEAFRSGASNEAMHFFMDAMKLFPKEPVEESEREKYKDLELKLGFSQQAAGNNIEAIETFHRILLKYFGYSFPSSEMVNTLSGILGVIAVMFKFQFQSFYFRKKPDEKFETFMKVVTQWGEAIATMNPKRFFFQSSFILSKLMDYDLSGSVVGLSVFTECSSLFMWTGFSFSLSEKILKYAKKAKAEDHPGSLIDYRYTRKMHDFFTGSIEEDRDFEMAYQAGMKAGDFWPTTIYTLYSGLVSVELGHYSKLMEYVHKLEEISESFDNSHAHAEIFRLSTPAHYRFRKLDRALELAEEGIRYTDKTGHFALLLVIWCYKSLVHSEKKDMGAAKEALSHAAKLVKDRKIITIYHFPYVLAKAQVELHELKTAIGRNEKTGELAKKLFKTIHELIGLSKKMRSSSTEVYRLKAIACLTLGKQREACRNFILSIQAGQKYNCILELSRTYFEAGKCLKHPDSRRSSLLGTDGSQYLMMARRMFEEMDLQWDLQEYERYVEGQ